MNTRTALSLALALALSSAAAWAAEPVMQVAGERAQSSKAQAPLAWRDATTSAAASRLVLTPMAPERILELERHNEEMVGKVVQVGIERSAAEAAAPLGALAWKAIEGGSVARFEVRSPDALALRVGLKLRGMDDRIEMRVAGSDEPARIEGMTTGSEARRLIDDRGLHWTMATDGEIQAIELFAPTGVDFNAVQVQVAHVSHLVASLRSGFALSTKIGESDGCNVDTACRIGTLGQAFADAKDSVSWLLFQRSGSKICTGTLLNDTDNSSQIPYYFTADHCIGSQAVANTVTTVWNYEATSCGSGVSKTTSQVGGGAQLLFNDYGGGGAGTDAALLRLNNTPPGFAFYAGWDANPLAAGADVLAIHHPAGDAKKSSLGKQTVQSTYLNEVGWLSGTTQGGSSGSGLFTGGAGGYYLRGGLYGGEAACSNSGNLDDPENWDVYSRLDVVYNDVKQWLAPTVQSFGPSNGRDYTGAWYVPSEAGWGLTVYQYAAPTYNQFVMFFIYDNTGKAQWFELDATWTATDVRSGTVYASNAAPWSTTFNPNNRSFTAAGTATITYTSATTANVQFTINGVTRSAAIQKL
ncbi:trypsin-like peptidase domain-containing protein [uncultured Arenimonas sp.]|uniref:trypsin-like serine peptidase n=1 Tax=uncultured Arenimonas sp. TaxID=546226 RepID=UPI0030DBD247